MDEIFLTTKQVAEMLKIKPDTVRDYCKKGKLTAFKQGRQNLVAQSSLDAYLVEMKSKLVVPKPELAERSNLPIRKTVTTNKQ